MSAMVEDRPHGVATRAIHWATAMLVLSAWVLALLFVPPLHSRDAFSYAAQGYLMTHGLDPYTVASGAVGIITACLDACTTYAKDRKVAGEEIGRKQLVQQMIAKMAQGRDIGRLLYYQVGWMKNQGLRHTRECSMAKWTNCKNAFDAANDAVEIHGAYGYSDEFPVERYFRNSRGAMIYEGTHEIHTIMQAEYELGYRRDKPLQNMLPTYPFE